ncbi:MAG: putative Ig domain-containing protein [Proteobacteria bacterium]|nr:putative Ig domain-containing protein [Pseudomonadota bacterium]
MAPNLSDIGSKVLTTGTPAMSLEFANSGGDPQTDGCTTASTLPVGLAVERSADGSSCRITGTPTEVSQGIVTITVAAINATGRSQATLQLTVLDGATVLMPPQSVILLAGVEIGDNSAIVISSGTQGLAPGSCNFVSTDQATTTTLDGLTISTHSDSCRIAGTPPQVATTTDRTYSVVAQGVLGGNFTTSFSVTVRSLSIRNKQVSASENYTCTVRSGGELHCWGDNYGGKLGIGDKGSSDTPTFVGSNSDWATVTAGDNHACAITNSGALYCWGANDGGRLGFRDMAARNAPTQVGTDTDWAAVSIGLDSTCATKSSGELYCWGGNLFGQLGLGDSRDRNTPTKVGTDTNWVAVSVGDSYTCAIKSTGNLYCWGRNYVGQLGLGDNSGSIERSAPTQVGADTDWSAISAGNAHTCAIKNNSSIHCWGMNFDGQLGLGDNNDNRERNTPTPVGTDTDWSAISAGDDHTCATKVTGEIFCWGRNFHGQLGIDRTESTSAPTQVGTNNDWFAISAGNIHTCAIRLNGQLHCWGNGSFGQLGLGDPSNISAVYVPEAVTPLPPLPGTAPDLANIDLTDSATPTSFNGGVFRAGRPIAPIIFANTGGDVRASGCTIDTAASSPTLPTGLRLSPVVQGDSATCQITGVPAVVATKTEYTIAAANVVGTDATAATVSFAVTIVSPLLADITAAQTVVAGAETDEIIFTNTGLDVRANGCQVVPELPAGLNAVAYDDSGKMTCAITGTALIWSARRPYSITATSANGEVDSATAGIAVSPEPLRLISQASLGDDYTCTVSSDSKLNCWGKNTNGELGLGDTDDRNTPFRAGLDTDWSALSAGGNHACATKTTGELYCWGSNLYGQLGTGTGTDLATPTQVGTDTDWAVLSAGNLHTCATKTTGELYCWGNHFNGRIGIAGSVDSNFDSPTQVGTDTDWLSVSAGNLHTCATKTTGELYCWGNHTSGQLGTGSSVLDDFSSPVPVGTRTNWVAVSTGDTHTCAINNAGRLHCWGDNSNGQLGFNIIDGGDLRTPTQVGTNSEWSAISTGASHTCAIKTNGALYCWGDNTLGQLGQSDTNSFTFATPTQVGTDSDWVTINAGNAHTCAVKNTGSLYCWGRATAGQLGLGDNGESSNRTTPTLVSTTPMPPTVAPNLTSIDLTALATPARFNAGVFRAGRIIPPVVFTNTGADVRAGGCTIDTAAGSPDLPLGLRISPTLQGNSVTCHITGVPSASASMTEYSIAAVNAVGTDASATTVSFSVVVASPLVADIADVQELMAGVEAEMIVFTNTGLDVDDGGCTTDPALPTGLSAATYDNSGTMTCAITGTPQFWLPRRSYTITATAADGETNDATVVIEISPESLRRVVQVSLGDAHTCTISANGGLNCWGGGRDGQLGLGDRRSRNIPFRVGRGDDWSALSTGNNHTCAIKTSGELYCWGQNSQQQLGLSDGNGSSRFVPNQVSTDTDWSALGAGNNHTCAIKTSGELYCWGDNTFGQLGLMNELSSRLIQIGTDTDWSAISAGNNHTCAIKTSGELYCWGDNTFGQLGLGASSNTPSRFPTQIGTDTDWSAISAGSSHTCAIKTSSELYCWGRNNSAELGLGLRGNTTTSPTQVGTDTNWFAIGAGSSHTCAIKISGELYCWGENFSSQLGLGTNNINNPPIPSPTQVGTDTNWSAISTGASHTCAVKNSGGLYCWGDGSFGQLGLGDLGDPAIRRSPEVVTTPPPPPTVAPDLANINLTDPTTPERFNGGMFRAGLAMAPVVFANAGGDVGTSGCTTTSGSPALPAGLRISPVVQDGSVTCQVTGIPTAATTMTEYTIAATNVVGSDATAATVSFAVVIISPLLASVTAAQIIVAGIEIERITFINTGLDVGVDGCTVKPALPNGLSIAVYNDSGVMTCAISGTAQFWATRRSYSVAAASANGEIDFGAIVIEVTPAPLRQVQQASLGGSHTCGVSRSGRLSCWGNNFNGQLGLGDSRNRTSPFSVGMNADWATVSAGYEHTCAIKTNGQLFCWGANSGGRLGLGTPGFVDVFVTTRVGADTDWATVDAGRLHTCAIKTSGQLHCWGSNSRGRLGLGDNYDRAAPTRVGNNADWATVSASHEHTCAIKTSGQLHCWGDNSNGILGLGDSNIRTTPTRVGNDTDWANVSTGLSHTCATKTSGELFCWGEAIGDQIGMDGFVVSLVPVKIGTNTNWRSVGVGSTHTCTTTTSGELFCWGNGSDGQLGLGDSLGRDALALVGNENNWGTVSAGDRHTCATKTDGGFYCWGGNQLGQLGLGSDGINNLRDIPVVVTTMPAAMNGESRSRNGVYLAAPLASSISVDGLSQINVAVPAAVGSVTHHEVWRSLDGGIAGAVKMAASFSSTYTDSSVVAGATYYYLLKACSGRACSDFGLGAGVTVPR